MFEKGSLRAGRQCLRCVSFLFMFYVWIHYEIA